MIEIAKALVAFQSEMPVVSFDSDNPFFKSKYASLSILVKTATPYLVKNGLAISQTFEPDGTVITSLHHISGQSYVSKLKLEPVKKDPQGYGSSISYARRYSFCAILGVVSDEDDDGACKTEVKAEIKPPQKKEVKNETKPTVKPETKVPEQTKTEGKKIEQDIKTIEAIVTKITYKALESGKGKRYKIITPEMEFYTFSDTIAKDIDALSKLDKPIMIKYKNTEHGLEIV